MVTKLHSGSVTAIAPGRISARRPVPAPSPGPSTSTGLRPAPFTGPEVKDADTIERMRIAGTLAAEARDLVGSPRRAGRSPPTSWTGSVTSSSATTAPTPRRWATRASRSRCAPRSTRWSATASRTAPSSQDGDIVNIDITAFLNGVHGDTNATFLTPGVSQEVRDLVDRTREALRRAINAVKPGSTDQRDRAGDRVLREAVRLRRRTRVHRARHRLVLPLAAWSSRTSTTRTTTT